MKNQTQVYVKKMLLLLALGTVFLTQTAAYVDPATTSYVIQIVVGVVIAIGTAAGIFRNKIARLFKKKTTDDQTGPRKERKEHGGIVTAEDLMADDDEK